LVGVVATVAAVSYVFYFVSFLHEKRNSRSCHCCNQQPNTILDEFADIKCVMSKLFLYT
jgi:hypothetical protein